MDIFLRCMNKWQTFYTGCHGSFLSYTQQCRSTE